MKTWNRKTWVWECYWIANTNDSIWLDPEEQEGLQVDSSGGIWHADHDLSVLLAKIPPKGGPSASVLSCFKAESLVHGMAIIPTNLFLGKNKISLQARISCSILRSETVTCYCTILIFNPVAMGPSNESSIHQHPWFGPDCNFSILIPYFNFINTYICIRASLNLHDLCQWDVAVECYSHRQHQRAWPWIGVWIAVSLLHSRRMGAYLQMRIMSYQIIGVAFEYTEYTFVVVFSIFFTLVSSMSQGWAMARQFWQSLYTRFGRSSLSDRWRVCPVVLQSSWHWYAWNQCPQWHK